MQHRAIDLIARKLAAATALDGKLSADGLNALADEDDALLLARALIDGLKPAEVKLPDSPKYNRKPEPTLEPEAPAMKADTDKPVEFEFYSMETGKTSTRTVPPVTLTPESNVEPILEPQELRITCRKAAIIPTRDGVIAVPILDERETPLSQEMPADPQPTTAPEQPKPMNITITPAEPKKNVKDLEYFRQMKSAAIANEKNGLKEKAPKLRDNNEQISLFG